MPLPHLPFGSSLTFDQINILGIPLYLSHHQQYHRTISPSVSTRSPLNLVRHNAIITHSLKQRRWHALQVGSTWPQPVIPTLLVTPTSLLLGVGGKLVVHAIEGGAVGRAREYPIAKKFSGSRADIIGVVELGDGEFGIAQFDGTLQKIGLPDAKSTAHYAHPNEANVHTLAASPNGDLMMTTTSTGLASVFKYRSPWSSPDVFPLRRHRAWSSFITPDALLLGVTGSIDVYPYLPTGPLRTPSRVLYGPDPPSQSSPYDMITPPSPSVHHPSLLLSGWYDSHLRLHDLRRREPGPVLEMSDPWAWADGSAMYSCAFLGENHVAGGGARHGTVALFDLRSTKRGWSCFSPDGRGSPVYKLVGEGGRLWGVTERRAFVLTFDGSAALSEGVVKSEARALRRRVKSEAQPVRGKGRGGKWNGLARHGEEAEAETVTGYEHSRRGVSLFDSLIPA